MARLTLPKLEGHLYAAADILRGKMETSDFEDFIFGIRGYLVPRPLPDEQRRIAVRADAFLMRLAAEELQLSKLQCLKRGLAHDLLTGRARVNLGGAAK